LPVFYADISQTWTSFNASSRYWTERGVTFFGPTHNLNNLILIEERRLRQFAADARMMSQGSTIAETRVSDIFRCSYG
jgi:hypothetical protein